MVQAVSTRCVLTVMPLKSEYFDSVYQLCFVFIFTAVHRIRIRPRFLRDVSQRSTATQVLGIDLSMPIAVAPTAMHRMAHADGELATARGTNNNII